MLHLFQGLSIKDGSDEGGAVVGLLVWPLKKKKKKKVLGQMLPTLKCRVSVFIFPKEMGTQPYCLFQPMSSLEGRETSISMDIFHSDQKLSLSEFSTQEIQ